MRKSVVLVIFCMCLLTLSSVLIACGQAEPVTQTVTQPVIMTEYVTTTPNPVTITVTRVAGTPAGVPAGTPHSIFDQGAGFGRCFTCHQIPPFHEGRNAVEEVCTECHYELPRDQWTTTW